MVCGRFITLTYSGQALEVATTITEVKKNDIQAEVKCDTFFDGNPDPNQNPGGGGAGPLQPLSVYPRLVT